VRFNEINKIKLIEIKMSIWPAFKRPLNWVKLLFEYNRINTKMIGFLFLKLQLNCKFETNNSE
jgi:hypothetical protein